MVQQKDKLFLPDYERWDRANGDNFDSVGYVSVTFSSSKIPTDLVFAFLEIFWPDFTERDGLVFRTDAFVEATYQRFKVGWKAEFWMNNILLDGLVPGLDYEYRLHLGKQCVDMWRTKLQRDFPDKKFDVKVLDDYEEDEVGITFHQIL